MRVEIRCDTLATNVTVKCDAVANTPAAIDKMIVQLRVARNWLASVQEQSKSKEPAK